MVSLLTKFLGLYFRSGWRGSYRLSQFLGQHLKSLQSFPIQTESGTLFADLRISSTYGILAYPNSRSGEDKVMRQFVKKGDTVFDIGAHLGLYTLLLSELVGEEGKVFAFEPNPELLPLLKKTVEPLANVELFQMALSDREGEISLFVPEDATMASLSDWTAGNAGVVHQVKCDMHILDNLVEQVKLSLPQFIKCDVEGAELSIFRGGVKTLDRIDAPIVLFEVNAKAADSFGQKVTDYFDFLEGLRKPKYVFFEVLIDRIKKLKTREVEYTNVVVIPKNRCDPQMVEYF